MRQYVLLLSRARRCCGNCMHPTLLRLDSQNHFDSLRPPPPSIEIECVIKKRVQYIEPTKSTSRVMLWHPLHPSPRPYAPDCSRRADVVETS